MMNNTALVVKNDEKIDIDKMVEVLEAGGKVYLNPIDYEMIAYSEIGSRCLMVFKDLVKNDFIAEGTMVAIKASTQ
jgi:hypothetical protein